MKKRLLLTALMVLPLFACGGSNTSSLNPNDDGDLVRDENGNIVYNNVKLKMWSVTTGDDAQTQDSIIADFNNMYKGLIEVEVQHHSRYDLEQLLNTTMQFDKENAPDLMFNHGSRAAEYKARNWLIPCYTYFEKSGVNYDINDFAPSLLNSVKINGELYGMPIDVHSAMIEIRVDILEKNNLSIPSNYVELVEVCQKATELAKNNKLWIRGENSTGTSSTEWRLASNAEDYTPFPISFGDMWVHEYFGYTASIQNGGSIVNEENELPSWYSNETNRGLQLLRDWIFPSSTSKNKVALSKDYGSSYDVGDAPFKNGNAIFKLQGPWSYAKDIADFERTLAKDGGANNITTRSLSNMLALDTSKEYASKIKGEGHAIMMLNTVNSTTKACAATVFMEYMAYYGGINWAKRGHIPAAQSVSLAEEYTSDPAYEQYIKYWGSANDYVVVQPTKNYSYVDSYFKEGLQKVISSQFKNQSVDEIMKKQYEDCLKYIELFA